MEPQKTLSAAELREFLEGFVGGAFHAALRKRVQQEINAIKDSMVYPGQPYEELVYKQGLIGGLEFDPVQTLLKELKKHE
ncbi:MAG: hypothetical protein QW318_06240 [Candidatus Caldarchaeum sp.]